MNTSKLPQTDSIEELAKFWDNHDVTDFNDELEEVTVGLSAQALWKYRKRVKLYLLPAISNLCCAIWRSASPISSSAARCCRNSVML